MNYVNLVQRIRACESEVTAQLVLEKWIHQFQYTVGVDIGKQQDHCHVVVVCKHFEGSPAFIVYSQDLTAQANRPAWVGLTKDQLRRICGSVPSIKEAVQEAEAILKGNNS